MALKLGSNERVRIQRIDTLSDNWYVLRKVVFDWLRNDGSWQRQEREAYDRGNGAAALLYTRSGVVVLTKQFRMPIFVNGHSGMLIEVAAGLLDEADPETAIRREVEEETGFRPSRICKVFEAFMSPGSVTERLYFFLAEIEDPEQVEQGGGKAEEGEDIDVLKMELDQALDMIASGAIADAKTIMLLQHLALNRHLLLDA
jgi:nudix-type nucleoside diphosphatase (YffH/AdpP family)